MEQKSKACLVKLGVRRAKALASRMSDITASFLRIDNAIALMCNASSIPPTNWTVAYAVVF